MTDARGRTRVAILGSTGSIGRQALDVLAAHGDRFKVVGLAAGRGGDAFEAQVAQFRPAHVATAADGTQALADMAAAPEIDMLIVATTGIVSLVPTLAALQGGKVVATANKETLVAGGHLVMPLARKLAERADVRATNALAYLRPIDSEHCAIWQCLNGEMRSQVTRLILTGSGGPFREWQPERLVTVTPEDALKHPTWRMGPKITIDSATLMNKALEVIEARWLYDVDDDQIDVVIHPQSVIHSMVEFADGSIKAQLGLPDMRIP
ncbi:MAG TPA: 1-deoxy-D-xylulose-5-phosphate reductoisomerase, partial [Gemmatimonadales bacterium]|nr:1-deoxy-D-xylulose-5-phosphate reductoisomerase [Gemmatimonadales bacterium]